MIRAVLYLELQEGQVGDPTVLAICKRAAEIEAEQHNYVLNGQLDVTDGPEPGLKLLVYGLQTRS